MRTLSVALIAGGMFWFIVELISPGILPRVAGSDNLSVVALGVGLILLWLSERDRQRRKWKGLDRQQKKYYD